MTIDYTKQSAENLDPKILKVMSALKQTETKGQPDQYNAVGDAGTSHGAFQFQDNTWKDWAGKYLKDPNAPQTKGNQNYVAYNRIKDRRDAGLQPSEIASEWNSGDAQAYLKNHKGVTMINGQKVAYDTPAYVQRFNSYLSAGSGETKKTAEPTLTEDQNSDQASAAKTGAFFPANTQNGNPLLEGAKVIPNMIPSVFNFVKGAIDTVNPVSIIKKFGAIGTEAKALGQDTADIQKTNDENAAANQKLIDLYNQKKQRGLDVSQLDKYFKGAGIDPTKGVVAEKAPSAFGLAVKSAPKATYETLVPEAARDLIKGDTKSAQRAITNDPFGQIAPFVFAAKGAADMADTAASKSAMAEYVKEPFTKRTIPEKVTKYSDAFDTGMKKTASVVTKPASFVADKVGTGMANATRFGVSQATGLNPETITEVTKTPDAFTKQAMKDTTRQTLGSQVQSKLAKLSEEKSSTGKEYQGVRANKTPIKVESNFWDDTFKETTGLDIKKGKLQASTVSKIRDAGDVRALQKVYDFWKPKFKQGSLTPEEYLNMREDLANAAKFEKDIGKRKDVEVASGQIRAKLNTAYRPQIDGLKDLDASMSEQITQYKELARGLVDKNGEITDAGLAKIANISKNKPALAAQLERIVPGITEQVKRLQAVTDIERASGIKVGTYGRAAGAGIGFLAGGPIGAVVEAVLTSPDMAVPILRKYGMLKNARAVQAVLTALKKGGSAVNNLPSRIPATPTSVFGGRKEISPVQ